MSDDKETPQNVIEMYRKRQQSARRAPVLFGGAAVLLVLGLVAIVIWFTGSNRPSFSLFASDTPTPTNTATATLTPTATSTPEPTLEPSATPTITITPTIAGPFVYQVAEGDSCWSIAVQFKVDLLLLITINNLDPSCPIKVGDKLTIPGVDTSLPTSTPLPANLPAGTIIEYRVQSGDTLGSIALQFNSTVDAIIKENKITDANAILVGTLLKIPVNIVTPVPTATSTPLGAILLPSATSTTSLSPTATATRVP